MAFDLDDEELEATRRMHGLDKIDENDTFIDKIEKENNINKEIQDLIDFADLLRPEQRYYTNLIKKIAIERQQLEQMYLGQVDKTTDTVLLYNKLLKENRELEAKLEFKQWGDLDNLKFEEYIKELIKQEETDEKI